MEIDEINSITVLGAGNMGHGIAEVAAMAGYDVTMRDIEEEFVQDGYDNIEWSLNKLAEKDRMSQEEADAALERVTPIVDLEAAVEDADVVIEAVPEVMDIKRETYEEIDEYAPEDAIFASNTSSLSITALSETTDRPEQFCGMHFFNPPVRMDLVEVISGAHSSEETLETIEALADAMDKSPVRVHKDSPGFVVNRVLVPLMNEAAWLVSDDEATIAEVDSTTKFGMGLPMGSFELADLTGIDVSYHVLEYMEEELGDAYEVAPLIAEKVEAEDLGQKSGKGFYDYENGGVDIPTDAQSDLVESRLLACMANQIAFLVGNDVAGPDAIDRAVKLGAGFPDGPAKLADEHGLDDLLATLESAHEETGHPRYEPAPYLAEAAEAGGFHAAEDGGASAGDGDDSAPDFETISVEYPGDMVGKIVVDRPHRMNTISTEVLDELDVAIDLLEDDEEVRAILLRGAGDRAFSAGADVQSMAAGANPLDAVELSRKGQATFGKLADCDMPVIAGIDGYCLGGGMELATCADIRLATERSTLGQPELDLGLLPGWGGTQRLQQIVGMGRAKEIILTADQYDPESMADFGFVNEVHEVDGFDEVAHEYAADLAAGPPIAQRYTKRAMKKGRESTEAGLEIESQAFGQLMNTDDLMEGVTAFMGDEDPEFEGK
ncbi:3-hydroxyacyl-CoA dehydrogenase/enoyl-CoA hydratase family protein [Salinarchaeum chitinilyticum]